MKKAITISIPSCAVLIIVVLSTILYATSQQAPELQKSIDWTFYNILKDFISPFVGIFLAALLAFLFGLKIHNIQKSYEEGRKYFIEEGLEASRREIESIYLEFQSYCNRIIYLSEMIKMKEIQIDDLKNPGNEAIFQYFKPRNLTQEPLLRISIILYNRIFTVLAENMMTEISAFTFIGSIKVLPFIEAGEDTTKIRDYFESLRTKVMKYQSIIRILSLLTHILRDDKISHSNFKKVRKYRIVKNAINSLHNEFRDELKGHDLKGPPEAIWNGKRLGISP